MRKKNPQTHKTLYNNRLKKQKKLKICFEEPFTEYRLKTFC